MNQLVVDQFTPFPGISAQVYSRADFEAVRDIVYEIVVSCCRPARRHSSIRVLRH